MVRDSSSDKVQLTIQQTWLFFSLFKNICD